MHSHGGPRERGETTLSAFSGMGLGDRAPKIGGLSPRDMFSSYVTDQLIE